MAAKPVIPRKRANQDAEDAVAYYLAEGAEQAALGFVDALERAFAQMARHPGMGSSRFGYELGIPRLRSWPLARFPYLAFYVERADHLDVWRVLHGRQDIPAYCQPPDPE